MKQVVNLHRLHYKHVSSLHKSAASEETRTKARGDVASQRDIHNTVRSISTLLSERVQQNSSLILFRVYCSTFCVVSTQKYYRT